MLCYGMVWYYMVWFGHGSVGEVIYLWFLSSSGPLNQLRLEGGGREERRGEERASKV